MGNREQYFRVANLVYLTVAMNVKLVCTLIAVGIELISEQGSATIRV